jgi:hypothetical protein
MRERGFSAQRMAAAMKLSYQANGLPGETASVL